MSSHSECVTLDSEDASAHCACWENINISELFPHPWTPYFLNHQVRRWPCSSRTSASRRWTRRWRPWRSSSWARREWAAASMRSKLAKLLRRQHQGNNWTVQFEKYFLHLSYPNILLSPSKIFVNFRLRLVQDCMNFESSHDTEVKVNEHCPHALGLKSQFMIYTKSSSGGQQHGQAVLLRIVNRTR